MPAQRKVVPSSKGGGARRIGCSGAPEEKAKVPVTRRPKMALIGLP